MQSDLKFITLADAEQLTRKSRATLVRFCNKVKDENLAFKDTEGTWRVDKEALLKHFNGMASTQGETKSDKQSVGSDAMVDWLQKQVETLNERVKELLRSNQYLIQENAELKQIAASKPREQSNGERRTYWVLIAILVVVAAGLLLVFVIL